MVARDLKALGLYQARALSYDGVEVELLEHPLTPEQRRIYDAYAGAFKVIHRNIEDALKATGIMEGDATLNKNAKSAALSAFEGAKQRFFGHLLTAMKCPSLDPVRGEPILRQVMPASSSWSPPARLCWIGASPISPSRNGTTSPST